MISLQYKYTMVDARSDVENQKDLIFATYVLRRSRRRPASRLRVVLISQNSTDARWVGPRVWLRMAAFTFASGCACVG